MSSNPARIDARSFAANRQTRSGDSARALTIERFSQTNNEQMTKHTNCWAYAVGGAARPEKLALYHKPRPRTTCSATLLPTLAVLLPQTLNQNFSFCERPQWLAWWP